MSVSNDIMPPNLMDPAFMPALLWLGKHADDWVTLSPEKDNNNRALIATSVTGAPDLVQYFLDQLHEVGNMGVAVTLFALSKAFADGPKLLRLTDDQCRALEHVDLQIPFEDYAQPYPAMFVELPAVYRQELFQRFKEDCETTGLRPSRYVLVHHNPQTKYVNAFSLGTNCYAILSPRPEYSTLEDCLSKCMVEAGVDIDISDIMERIAVNACYMLTHLGTKTIGPCESAKKLKKAIANGGKRAERAKRRLDNLPTIIGFAQNIQFHSTSGSGENTHSRSKETVPRKPHWRRGFFRKQRFGPGLEQVKTIFIRPKFINRQHFSGEMAQTEVVYSGTFQ